MPDLPSGTITFLFTDIEGSTQLWEQHPEAMKVTLAQHDTILRDAIEGKGGYVFKTVGDAFCAAFSTPPEALATALSAQQALQAEEWGETGPLRVRMALHTGVAEERENDYFGQPLNRVARLLSTGYGMQILLSLATAELVRDALPKGASLRELGFHRLKDLQRPEQVYQLLHSDLTSEFPPLKSLDTLRHNLPVQLTSFIGREREIEEVKKLLSSSRLVTLTGSGGCGKTRLSLQAAAELIEEYPEGLWLVELASLTDPGLVPQTLASVLGMREVPGRPLLETLSDYLKARNLLLVLDNCEHLVEACAELASSLLGACPNLKILATSREGLGVAGETTWNVPSLSMPEPQRLPPMESLSQYEAVRLFIERAESVQPGFEVTDQNAPAVAQICHRLDGIPLAIELAAARVRVLSVEQINARLEDRFRLLTGGSRIAMPRQRTLRGAVEWSYELLSEPEHLLFNRLSVFTGGFILEAVETVCAGEGVGADEVLDLLSLLVDKSLVMVGEGVEGEVRYRLLETLRQYGRERLAAIGEADETLRRHAAFFFALAEEAGQVQSQTIALGPQEAAWLDRLEQEHDNLRAALGWCVESGEAETGLRLGEGIFFSGGHVVTSGRGVSGYLDSGRCLGHQSPRRYELKRWGALVY